MRQVTFLMLLAAFPALAQQSSLNGVVSDSSGLPLPAVTVTIKSVETGLVRSIVTDEAGRYSAPGLAVGQYQVTAVKEGFTTSRKRGSRS